MWIPGSMLYIVADLLIMARYLQAEERRPAAGVIGIDPDPKALAQARRKAGQAGVSVPLVLGDAQTLPYPDGAFERVLSALMFHHLPADAKLDVLREARRVLKPGGSLHLVDFVPADKSSAGFFSHLLHPSHGSRFGAAAAVPVLMAQAGFDAVAEVSHQSLILGRIASYRALLLAPVIATAP